MAWDEAPPTKEEIAPAPASESKGGGWDAAPPTADELEGMSLGGFAKNAVKDVGGIATGLGHLAKGLATHPIDTVSQIPGSLIDEGKRVGIGELLTGHPINAVNKLAWATYNKPVSTYLDAEGLTSLYGLGSKVLKNAGKAGALAEAGAEIAPKAASDIAKTGPKVAAERMAGEAPPPVALPKEASDILKEPISRPEPTPTTPSTEPPAPGSAPAGAAQDTLSSFAQKIPGDIKSRAGEIEQFLSNKYGQIAKRPGFANTMADYLGEHAQNMTLKELGAAPGQIRKIGIDRARALADYARENGLVGPKIGPIGREQAVAGRLEQAGGAVGGLRKMAADRGAIHDVDSLISQVRSQLDNKYLSKTSLGDLGEVGGLNSGEANLYTKALAELKRSGGRADDVSHTLTKMFGEARNLDRLKQPSGPIADVARIAREANDNLIRSKLKPEEASAYGHALEDYGALTQLNEFIKRRASTEAGGRLGPGAGISRAAVQKFLDSVGYRIESKAASKLAEMLRGNPEIAQSPKNLFRHLSDEYSSAIDEMADLPQ